MKLYTRRVPNHPYDRWGQNQRDPRRGKGYLGLMNKGPWWYQEGLSCTGEKTKILSKPPILRHFIGTLGKRYFRHNKVCQVIQFERQLVARA